MKYYYIISDDNKYVVTEIAKGGSRAGRISDFNLKSPTNPPLLINNRTDANRVLEKEPKISGYKDKWEYTIGRGKNATDVVIRWIVKEVDVNI